eukprot:TRINITY_DN50850_c0_g1_i1.p2 TRINITY_DN50850_c0_g1~~TRINITY_DN50850_c0_g1_i1.p2  ORF type:complete len:280 (+),score=106.35 TRINITY_DN50850_c0_g1_i1:78-842(+)
MPPRGPKTEFISLAGLRLDGRRANDVRQIEVNFDGIGGGAADGSAVVEQGATRVAALVYGPREVQGQTGRDRCHISCDMQYAAFASSSGHRRHLRGDSMAVKDTVDQVTRTVEDLVLRHLFPNSAIQIHLQVLGDDGGVLCALLNAVTCALVSAGVPVRDMLCACSATVLQDTTLVDLTDQEARGGGPELSLAIMPTSGRVALMLLDHPVDVDRMELLMREATAGCEKIHAELSRVLRERAEALLRTTVKEGNK